MRYAKASCVSDHGKIAKLDEIFELPQVPLNFQHISLNRKGNTLETHLLLWKDSTKMIEHEK